MLKKLMKKSLPEVRIYIYGFRAGSTQIESEIKKLIREHDSLKSRAFLINVPDAQVSDLSSDSRNMAYITVVCSDKKTLASFKNLLTKDSSLKQLFFDFQQPASYVSAGHI